MTPVDAGKRLVIVGATGMVGGYAVRYALDRAAVGGVTTIGRKPTGITHPKLNEVLHQDFADCSRLADALSRQDAAIFCLGAYTGAVSDADLRKVTAFAVEWASEPRFLKLMRPLNDAVFTITPWLVFRCGHAARVRKNTRSTSSRRTRSHSSSVMSLEPVEVRHRGVVEQHVDAAKCAHGKIDEGLTIGWVRELARLERDHRSTCFANHGNCGFRRVDVQIASDDRCTLPSECHGRRAAHAAAGSGDDTHLS
jgi:NAD-dependent epimerase/dehydratase family protein